MNKTVFYIIIVLLSFSTVAQQNLVPNPSFEEYSSCPTGNELGNGQFTKCNDWWYPHSPSIGSPDYFNACNDTIGGSNQGMVGVPSNFLGYQEAFHGDAYVGLDLFSYDTNILVIVAKEMIQTKLIQSLKTCHQYHFSMYVSLANIVSHSAISIGIVLSSNMIYFTDFNPTPATWVNSSIIHDTLNWIKIEGEFIASGSEQYLTIGYFNEFNQSELLFNDSTTINFFGTYDSYYYIDSVSLYEINEVSDCVPEIPNIITPNGDLINDIISIEGLALSSLTIINRWGNEIITLTDESPTWDGTSHGKKCTDGTYFYVADFNGTKLTGFIQLVR